MLLAKRVSTFLINGKSINGLKKLRNPPFWPELFIVAPFKEIRLFSKDLVTFAIPFISLFFFSVSQKTLNTVKDLRSSLLLARLYPASERALGIHLPTLILPIITSNNNFQ